MRSASPLNEHQQRHLSATCQYIERQLSDLEAILATTGPASTFTRYLDDLTDEQKARLRHDCTSIRAELGRVLASLGIDADTTKVSSRHSMRAALTLIEVAIEELKPRHMKQYGPMTANIEPQLNGLVVELQTAVQRLDGALATTASSSASPATTKDEAASPAPPTRAISRTEADAVDANLRKTAAAFEDVRVVIEKLRDPVDALVFEALEHGADRASRLMDGGERADAALDHAVHEGITEVGTERAEDVRRALANLIAKVKTTFQSASTALGTAEPSAPSEWMRQMRDVPPFVIENRHVEFKMFMRRALGAGVAHSRARRSIEQELGARITEALTAHGASLYEWATRVLSRVRDDFSTEADSIRQHLK